MAEDDFADFTSTCCQPGQKDDGEKEKFHVFDIPPLDFDEDTAKLNPDSSTISSSDLFSLPLTLPSNLPSHSLLPSSSFEPLPSNLHLQPLTYETLHSDPLPSFDIPLSSMGVVMVSDEGGSDLVPEFLNFDEKTTDVSMATGHSETVADNSFVSFSEETVKYNDMTVEDNITTFHDFASFSNSTAANSIMSTDVHPVPITTTTTTTTTTDDFDDQFGEFGSFGSITPSINSASLPTTNISTNDSTTYISTNDFEDDFGEFGSFDTAQPTLPSVPKVTTPFNLKAPKEAVVLCFPVECSQSSISANSKNILDYLSDESSERVWSELSIKAKSTRFFFQWNNSFLQDHFYSAVKVDPMLVPANIKALGPLREIESLPVGGEKGDRGFGQADEGAATLLDLSLPLSPSPGEKVLESSFDDLLGLSLSDDQLVPVTDSSAAATQWMDSELLELVDENERATSSTTTSTYDWLSRLAKTTPKSIPINHEPESDLLVETKSSGYDLLVSGIGDDDMGWSFTKTLDPVVMDTIPVAMDTEIDPVVIDTIPVAVDLKPFYMDTTPLDSIPSLFPNPKSFPTISTNEPVTTNLLNSSSEPNTEPVLDLHQCSLILLEKLPQLDFMTSKDLKQLIL